MATTMDPLVPELEKHCNESNNTTLRKTTPADIFKEIRKKDKLRIESHQRLEKQKQINELDKVEKKHEIPTESNVDTHIVMIDSDNEIDGNGHSSVKMNHKINGISISSLLMGKPNNKSDSTIDLTPEQPKGVSLTSLLTGTKKKEIKTKIITFKVDSNKLRSVLNPVEIIPDEDTSTPIIIAKTKPQIQIDKNNKTGPILKSGRFDIKATKLKSQTRFVTLKIEPGKLNSILKKESKPETSSGKTDLDDESFPILLDDEEEEDDIKEIQVKKPLPKGTIMNSFFKEIAERAVKSTTTTTATKEIYELRKKQKQESSHLNPLTRDMFHIYDKEEVKELYEGHENPLNYLIPKQPVELALNYSPYDFDKFMENYRKSVIEEFTIKYESTIYSGITLTDIATQKYDNLSDSRFKKFLHKEYRSNQETQWCDLFKPTSYKEILQGKSTRKEINNWIQNAFKRLKKVDRFKRESILKKKRAKKSINEFDDLINDFEEDNETEEEIFVPSMIIEGPHGCGKTSSVYAIMKEQLQGIVFEINSSQARAKKDISFHLKQVGTTQVVNKDQNGVILFDDVDLIDEEEDRDFWVSVTELLTYSYRPVIFTTSDVSKIPEHILNESTICSFVKAEESIEKEYLDLACLSMGYMLSDDILTQFSKNDLRNSLADLQMFCYRFETFPDSITEISIQKEKKVNETKSNLEQLIAVTNKLDMEIFDNRPNDSDIEYYGYGYEDKIKVIEFYSSKLFSNGSRSRTLKYNDGEDYLEHHPGCCFNRLGVSEIAYEITPFIREMARAEADRRVKLDELESTPRLTRNQFVLSSLMEPIPPLKRFEGDTNNLLWSFPRI